MATTIATLAAKLSLDNKQFLGGFKQSAGAAKQFSGSMTSVGATLTKVGGAIGAAALAGRAARTSIGAVADSLERAGKMSKEARKVGKTFEEFRREKFGEELAGGLAEADGLMKRFSLSLAGLPGDKLVSAANAVDRLQVVAKLLTDRLVSELGPSISRLSREALDGLERMGRELDKVGLGWKSLGGFAEAAANSIVNGMKLAESQIKATALAVDLLGGSLLKFLSTETKLKALNGILFGGLGSFGGNKQQGVGDLGAADRVVSTGKFKMPELPKALELNTADAVSAIYKANRESGPGGDGPAGDGISGVNRRLDKLLVELKAVNGNTNPLDADARGTAITLREARFP